MKEIQVRMLGDFTIQAGENIVSDAGNRTKKVWALLAYLICHKGEIVSQKKLISLFWNDESSTNPENVVRITFHRARTQLDKLWPGAGKELIVYKDAGYTWNDQIPVWLDFEDFENLCSKKSESEENRLAALREALALYKGDFLEKQSSELWVIPVNTHFHNLFVSATMEAAELLSSRGYHRDAANLCRRAVGTEPYHEELHQLLIRALAAAGDQEAAAEVYQELSKRLFEEFGIRPSEETKAVYRKAVHAPGEKTLSMDTIMEHLREHESKSGALRCDYDYFKVLCHVESRAMERYGNAAHVLMLSVSSGSGTNLTRCSIHRIMEQLGEQIGKNLRRGDTYSQCSMHQYIILLPRANYENSVMVSRRILGAFKRVHPHVTAQIHYMVQPLSPNVIVP